jgi:PadR family transcriptional regulator PadR
MTLPTLRVLSVLLRDPTRPIYGLELVKEVKSTSGTVYPILGRLERAGWIKGTWESANPADEGRPRRRFYSLTGVGQALATQEVEAHLAIFESSSRPVWNTGWLG